MSGRRLVARPMRRAPQTGVSFPIDVEYVETSAGAGLVPHLYRASNDSLYLKQKARKGWQ